MLQGLCAVLLNDRITAAGLIFGGYASWIRESRHTLRFTNEIINEHLLRHAWIHVTIWRLRLIAKCPLLNYLSLSRCAQKQWTALSTLPKSVARIQTGRRTEDYIVFTCDQQLISAFDVEHWRKQTDLLIGYDGQLTIVILRSSGRRFCVKYKHEWSMVARERERDCKL